MLLQTDVLPALAMCLEKPESDILTRKPRNVKTQHLVDWKLLLHAYGFIGILESLSASSMSVLFIFIFLRASSSAQGVRVPAAPRCPIL